MKLHVYRGAEHPHAAQNQKNTNYVDNMGGNN